MGRTGHLTLGPTNPIYTSPVAHSPAHLRECRVRAAEALPALPGKETFAAQEHPAKSPLPPCQPGAPAQRSCQAPGTARQAEHTGIKKPPAWPSPSPPSEAPLGWQVEERGCNRKSPRGSIQSKKN